MMNVGQKVYSAPWADQATTNPEETKTDDDWVQDAEVETDDDKADDKKTRV
jgi:hypothetical protein